MVYINDEDWSSSVTVETESDSVATEGDETFFIDFKSLHTLGRRPGIYNWTHDHVTGIPTDVSARVTIRNVESEEPEAHNPPPCIPGAPPWLNHPLCRHRR